MIKELLKQSSWYFVGYGVSAVLGLVTFPIWTRYFSIQEYGILSLIAATATFVGPIARLGLQKAVLRFFSEFRSGKRDLPESSFYTTFFLGALGLGAIVGLVFLGIVLALGPERFGGQQTHILFILVSIGFILGPGSTIYAPILRVEEKPKHFVLLRLIRGWAQLALTLIFLFVFLTGLKGLYIAPIFVQFLMILFIFFRLAKQKKLALSAFSIGLLFEGLRFGVPLIAAQLANHISNLGDRFVLQFLLGTEAVGLYAVGYGLTARLKSILTIWMFVVTPMYVSIWEKQGRKKTEEFLSTALDFYLMFAIPGIILFMFFGGDIVILMASAKYEAARVLVPYLAAPLVLHGAISIYTAGIFIHKKTNLIFYFTVASGILNIILNFILIPIMGITGAAVATIISYTFLIALANLFSSKFITIRLNYHGIGKYILASVIAAILVSFVNIEIFLGIILKLFIGILIYSAVMVLIDGRIRQKVRLAFK